MPDAPIEMATFFACKHAAIKVMEMVCAAIAERTEEARANAAVLDLLKIAKADNLHAITGQNYFAVCGEQATSLAVCPLPSCDRTGHQGPGLMQIIHVEPEVIFDKLALQPFMPARCAAQACHCMKSIWNPPDLPDLRLREFCNDFSALG